MRKPELTMRDAPDMGQTVSLRNAVPFHELVGDAAGLRVARIDLCDVRSECILDLYSGKIPKSATPAVEIEWI
jgi:hypothetical protein